MAGVEDNNKNGETASLKGGLTWGTTLDPYRNKSKRKGRPLGVPGGGGGGAWMNLGGASKRVAAPGKGQWGELRDKYMGGGKKKADARAFGQDLMRGEHAVGDSRQAADQRSNVNGAPPKPEWATGTGTANMAPGTSIFDPVLCELAYRWFCPSGGLVLDPFAGGSVRGVVASKLGRRYVGIDLRPEQVAANRQQGQDLCSDPMPEWIEGDSRDLPVLCEGMVPDLVFSCPPYADLERYSDDPRDLSTLDYSEFLAAYRQIVAASVALLRPDAFACFVVGDVRDRQGFYHRFVSDTESAFCDAGARLYNEAILVTSVGSLPIRAGRQFEAARKLGKTHQNVLVFCKGDPRRATQAVGPVEANMELFKEEAENAAEDIRGVEAGEAVATS